jgi:predicted transcriptional regulator
MVDSPYIEKLTLKEKRRSFGLTQKELAEMVGLSQMHISLVELGQLTFLQHQRASIESVLGPIDWDIRYSKLRRARKTTQ